MDKKPWRKLLLIHNWRIVISRVALIIKKQFPEAEIYLIGGAAEARLTINSDIDLAVVFRNKLEREERVKILETIWERIEDEVPLYYPLHVIILDKDEFKKLSGVKKKIM